MPGTPGTTGPAIVPRALCRSAKRLTPLRGPLDAILAKSSARSPCSCASQGPAADASMMRPRSPAAQKPSRTACEPMRGRESVMSSLSSTPSTKPRSRPWLRCWRVSTAAAELDPKAIVRQGYDRISSEYRDDAGHGPAKDQPLGRPDYEAWLRELMPLLRVGEPVLDLGCGCGLPATALLAKQVAVTGVDLSPVQIPRARRLVPAAHLQCP